MRYLILGVQQNLYDLLATVVPFSEWEVTGLTTNTDFVQVRNKPKTTNYFKPATKKYMFDVMNKLHKKKSQFWHLYPSLSISIVNENISLLEFAENDVNQRSFPFRDTGVRSEQKCNDSNSLSLATWSWSVVVVFRQQYFKEQRATCCEFLQGNRYLMKIMLLLLVNKLWTSSAQKEGSPSLQVPSRER